jgi:hypothetical protein
MLTLIKKKTSPAFTTVDPENPENLNYFSRRWRYSVQEIKEAILYTGSLQPITLIEYLRRNNYIYHPIKGLKLFYDHTRNLIF